MNETIFQERAAGSSESTSDPAQERAREIERFYHLARRQAWQVEQLPWGQMAPIPEGHGSEEKRVHRQEMWRSVITQQLQADMLASQMSVQLLTGASDHEARLYYSTMMQDEGRHAEAWLRLVHEVGGTAEPDPYLEKLGKLALALDTLEEKIWLLQVFYEGLVIDRFHQIAAATPNTILGDICTRLAIDDGIHHGAGVAYERLLLERASPHTKRNIVRLSEELWPIFVDHLLWRPRARSWASAAMRARDAEQIRAYITEGLKIAAKVGLEIDPPSGY